MKMTILHLFQSSPGLMAGRYHCHRVLPGRPDEVSILARLNGRALPRSSPDSFS